ncbi:uncharacterized protein [Oryza sativa Japonica Group]|uniref:Uncharacterized protein n=2 Tax=Oryza sativa subsp. japonica TaxID=39947 RepID=B9F3H1_ORYSJ|nr:uncharacterized protein LOC107277523 [Oryza sativa Japonica Group]XP_052142100.1 uncharacterized protein LOC127761809 [Oryza glaberrima]EEE57884.1 hypothetical protein OsJ_08550 [Oryza sativa Japonica Group]KAF2947188.1 hypothetical protein DAI22_02g349800 [Oryza sativa Japonica Group]BAD16866.1 hypothetical protein [Oryza sativa Japonica Group]BAS81132.1 Os02g0772400 [Oryza sativa Japonica Group]
MLSTSNRSLSLPLTPVCTTFAGGEEDGAFTEKQRKYPIKMRRRICASCGLRRTEHRADAGVGDEHHLPPRKRLLLRRGCAKEEEPQPEPEEEVETWSGDAIIVTRGKRAPRKKRDNAP